MRNARVTYRLVILILALIFGFGFSVPSFFQTQNGAKISLGLDLQGGLHMLLGVETSEAIHSKIKSIAGSINYYATFGDNMEKAVSNLRETLGLHLADLLDVRKNFPEPSRVEDIKLKENQYLYVISVDPVYEVAKVTNTLKKKTLTIPVWLDILAQEKNLNFSQILQKALKKELGIE